MKIISALPSEMLTPNAIPPCKTSDGREINIVDGLSVAQGPNYALAKRMQHWRAVMGYESGHVASTMVAPSTATISVIHNKTFAWAYGGMPAFGFEIFKQETTNAVMSAVLVHDVMNGKGPREGLVVDDTDGGRRRRDHRRRDV